MLKYLRRYIRIIAANSEHLCKDENKGQLEWAMWRFSNLFYSARIMGCGYDDSIGYFLDSFTWSDWLTDEQVEKIRMASCSHNHLSEFGYVDPEFNREIYICNKERFDFLENGKPSEVTSILTKEHKTFEDHVRVMEILYPNLLSGRTGADMLLTYYGGYRMENGYLVHERTSDFDVMFVYAWKKIPADVMHELDRVLAEPEVIDTQERARTEWEKRLVEHYKSQFMSRKDIPDELKEKMDGFTMSQWVYFTGRWLAMAKEAIAKEKDYEIIWGMAPPIKDITRESHPSYVKAALGVCERALASKATSDKDRVLMEGIRAKLTGK